LKTGEGEEETEWRLRRTETATEATTETEPRRGCRYDRLMKTQAKLRSASALRTMFLKMRKESLLQQQQQLRRGW
jgi:hypothetical protein